MARVAGPSNRERQLDNLLATPSCPAQRKSDNARPVAATPRGMLQLAWIRAFPTLTGTTLNQLKRVAPVAGLPAWGLLNEHISVLPFESRLGLSPWGTLVTAEGDEGFCTSPLLDRRTRALADLGCRAMYRQSLQQHLTSAKRKHWSAGLIDHSVRDARAVGWIVEHTAARSASRSSSHATSRSASAQCDRQPQHRRYSSVS